MEKTTKRQPKGKVKSTIVKSNIRIMKSRIYKILGYIIL